MAAIAVVVIALVALGGFSAFGWWRLTPSAASSSSPASESAPQAEQVTVHQLQSITAPPMCTRPAGKLVNGSLPVQDPDHNGYTVVAQDMSKRFLYAQSTAAQSPALAVVFNCSAGGVDWPDVIGFFDARLNLLGYQDLGDIDHHEHSAVAAVQFNGAALHVTWDTFEGARSGVCDVNEPDHETGDFTFDLSTRQVTMSNFTTSCPRGD